MAYLNKPCVDIVNSYSKLDAVRLSFCKMKVLPFGAETNERLLTLRKQKIRIGTMDLRIACIALANDATLLTCNLRDFEQVPNLKAQARLDTTLIFQEYKIQSYGMDNKKFRHDAN